MPLSLHLPFSVCYPATLLARRIFPPRSEAEQQDQGAYFARQQRETVARYHQHMAGLSLQDKTILDIGCGLGGRALGWLELGAKRVINVDINRQELAEGERLLRSRFPDQALKIDYRHPDQISSSDHGDLAILFDSFEHLTDPAEVLRQIDRSLRPGGAVWIGSIGWYNYMASHCTVTHIPIPWCQLLFSETAILKTIRKLLRRSDYVPNVWERMEGLDRWDNVKTLKDRPGEPLNMLSLRQIRRILHESPFQLQEFRLFGFGGRKNKLARLLQPFAQLPWLDELLHTYYTALLIKR